MGLGMLYCIPNAHNKLGNKVLVKSCMGQYAKASAASIAADQASRAS